LWLLVAAFMVIGLPVLVVVVPVTVLAGVVLAVVVVVRTLSGLAATGPMTITPGDVQARRAGLAKRRATQPFDPDPAWPHYLVAQWRVDLGTAWRAVTGILRAGFQRLSMFTMYPSAQWLRRICGAFAFLFWFTLCCGAVAGASVLLGLCWAVRTVAWLGWLAVAGVLRGGDFLVRRVRGAQPSCQHCYYVGRIPAFSCDRCGRLHHDLRPGRLGAVWRRCACGRRLHTTVLGASAQRLVARCQRCEQPLRPGSAVLTDIRLPLFGPVFAGKTRLMYAGLTALRDAAAANGAEMGFVDDESEQAFTNGAEVIGSGADTVKTPAGELPPALTVRFTMARRKALLHLFDAAGEFFADRDENTELEFLDHAQGLVFVVDPFSLPSVRDQLGDTAPTAPAAQDTESVYQVTVRRLRDYGVDTRRRGLAMTVVKADLLAGLPVAQDLLAGQVKEWLIEAGMDNLVQAAERDFGDVRYFLVASLPVRQAGPGRSPADPFGWLISRAGLALVPRADAPPQPATTEESS
jgi:double-GTPase-like protein